MANVFFIVEGPTEEGFYKNILQEYVATKHNFTVVIVPTKKNYYSRTHKGGTITFDSCVDVCRRFLRQASHADKVILTLDFYALHNSFFTDEIHQISQLDSKIDALEQRLMNEIGNSRFIFHLQLHEYEAWLFSNTQAVAEHFDGIGENDLIQILNKFNNNPELINDNRTTAPSKRILNIYPQYGKTSDGITLMKKIGIPTIRKACHHFNKLCTILDELPENNLS